MKYTAEQVAELNRASKQVAIEVRNRRGSVADEVLHHTGHFDCKEWWECTSAPMSPNKKYTSFYAFGFQQEMGEKMLQYWASNAIPHIEPLTNLWSGYFPEYGLEPLLGGVICSGDQYYLDRQYHWINWGMHASTQNLSRAQTTVSKQVIQISSIKDMTGEWENGAAYNEPMELFIRMDTHNHTKRKVSLVELVTERDDVHPDIIMLSYRKSPRIGVYINPNWLALDGRVQDTGGLEGAFLKPGWIEEHNDERPIVFAASQWNNETFWNDQIERYNITYGFSQSPQSESWTEREGELDFADFGF